MKQIYFNGKVYSGSLPLSEAFVVENGKFSYCGDNESAKALACDGDELIDLQGKFVCPGFNDSHMHLLNYGNTMEQCDLSGAATSSLAALQQAMGE